MLNCYIGLKFVVKSLSGFWPGILLFVVCILEFTVKLFTCLEIKKIVVPLRTFWQAGFP